MKKTIKLVFTDEQIKQMKLEKFIFQTKQFLQITLFRKYIITFEEKINVK
jgi:hypothetical protein